MSKIITRNRITWEEAVKRYPNSWVVLENVLMSDDKVVAGDLVCICQDNNVHQTVKQLSTSLSGKVIAQRTTAPIRGFGPFIMKLNLYRKFQTN